MACANTATFYTLLGTVFYYALLSPFSFGKQNKFEFQGYFPRMALIL